MSSKNFLLLSMEEEKIKKVSNVISNDSCRKILDYLSNKEATESELAEKLQIPISTIHYNIQQLMETGLIESKEFHYSEKGKEVNHYKLANKYIIIAPKKTFGIKEKLKSILPVALIISGTALVLQYAQKFFVEGGLVRIFTDTKQTLVRETFITQKAAESAVAYREVATGVSDVAKTAAAGAAQIESEALPAAIPEIVNQTSEYLLKPEVVTQTITTQPSVWSNIALWFLIGAVFALVIYLIINLSKKDFD